MKVASLAMECRRLVIVRCERLRAEVRVLMLVVWVEGKIREEGRRMAM